MIKMMVGGDRSQMSSTLANQQDEPHCSEETKHRGTDYKDKPKWSKMNKED